MKKRLLPFLVALIFLSLLFWRWWLTYLGQFNFSWDFARDMLWVRQLTIQHKPILVGPWGSLDGTFFGPLYYYLISLPLILFSGDPRAAVGLVVLLISLLIPVSFFFFRKKFDQKLAFLTSVFFALPLIFTQVSLFSFSQNVIPFFYLLFIIFQWWAIKKAKPIYQFWLFFAAGLFFHFEPVDALPAILIAAGIFIHLWLKNKLPQRLKSLAAAGLGLVIPFSANILFDFRHQFIQLKAFQGFLSGQNQSLRGGVSFWPRIGDRFYHFFRFLRLTYLNGLPEVWGKVFLAVVLLFCLLKANKVKAYLTKNSSLRRFLGLILVNLAGLFVFFIIFPALLKDYYLYPLLTVYSLLAPLGLWLAYKAKALSKVWLAIIVFLFALVNLLPLIKHNFILTNHQTFALQKQIVADVYALADNKPFKAYVYADSIYDYPYQYLFSWFGYDQFGYVPVDYAYLPDQPDYVLNKDFFDAGKPNRKDDLTDDQLRLFLILEPGDHLVYQRKDWLNHFGKKDVTLKKDYESGISLIAF